MKILIFGATGVIGSKAVELIKKDNKLKLVGISFNKNIKKAKKIANDFKNIKIYSPNIMDINNVSSYEDLIIKSNPDIVINSIIGLAGLDITLLAIKHKKNIALANKESVVMAGKFIFSLAKKNKVNIYPIDSEHSALMSLVVNNKKKIDTLYITASGGRYYKQDGKVNPKYDDAIQHPIWKMGNKITIDSSTMVNKFFEIVEAYYYFNIDKIVPIYHPQAIVHAMIKYQDNSVEANMSMPDMTWSIQQAINNFQSNNKYIKPLNFNNLNLEFGIIDSKIWKPIQWAYDFLKSKNHVMPLIINIANDTAIELFERGIIEYKDIVLVIESCIKKFKESNVNNVNDIHYLNDTIQIYIKKKWQWVSKL